MLRTRSGKARLWIGFAPPALFLGARLCLPFPGRAGIAGRESAQRSFGALSAFAYGGFAGFTHERECAGVCDGAEENSVDDGTGLTHQFRHVEQHGAPGQIARRLVEFGFVEATVAHC